MCLTFGYLIRRQNKQKKEEQAAAAADSPRKIDYRMDGSPNYQAERHEDGTVPPNPPNYGVYGNPAQGQQRI